MYKINFETPYTRVHFIGIGGISMSGLAEILLKEGFTISDPIIKNLPLQITLSRWVQKVFYGQKASILFPALM